MKKRIVPESVSQHIKEEYRKSREFRKAYDEEVLKLKIAYRKGAVKPLALDMGI